MTDVFAQDRTRYLQALNETATDAIAQTRLLADLNRTHAQAIGHNQVEAARSAAPKNV